MCGIMGYVGPRPASPIILQGLERLEYRGYDSAGVAVADGGVIERIGEDLFLYASDYPHEPDLAEAIREFDKRKDLSDTAKRKILSDNGKRFYNMEV